jgi:ATP-binding cassette, subfamily F, member 3
MPRIFFQISDLHKHYGTTPILDGASVAIMDDHRIGIIGRNGAGKSTLCRIILGEEQSDGGTISMHADLRLSYLEQKDPFRDGETVVDYLMRYSGCPDWRCGQLAGRFMLKNDLLAREVRTLSGGFQTRVRLCAMLLKEPNFLILDEPTNYLDLRTLLLLERFLTEYRGGYIIVSHDREFLKRTCTSTMEVERGQIALYPGDVESYLAYKAEQRAQAEAFNANVEIRRKQLQTFVDKNKAKASKATQAASKAKMLDRLETKEVAGDLAAVTITITPVESRQGAAIRIIDLGIGYPEKTVAEGISFEIDRGRHVAVVGDNGQGKTTFLSTIAGQLPPKKGEMRWGHGINVGTYAQHVFTSMDPSLTVQRYLERAAASSGGAMTPTQRILDMAGSFLFRGTDVAKKIAVLSGGERARLCLAGLMLSRCTVLLLDEPTNHLDFETVEALADALKTYDGTIFFTSHDRTFVSRVATDIVEVNNGKVELYGDDYAGYVYRIERETREGTDGPSAASAPQKAAAGNDKTTSNKAVSASDRKAQHEHLRGLRNQLKQVEKKVATLDAEKKKLSVTLEADPTTYLPEIIARLESVTAELDAQEGRWLELNDEIENSSAQD